MDDPSVKNSIASIYSNKGLALANLGRNAEAIHEYEAVILQHQTSDADSFISLVVAALVFKGNALRSLSKDQEAIAAYMQAQASSERAKALTPYAKSQLDASKLFQAAAEAAVKAAADKAAAIKT